jgi:hypothetical protein
VWVRQHRDKAAKQLEGARRERYEGKDLRLRGTAERWIKEGKAATHWTRLSCHRFWANEVHLLLGGIASTSSCPLPSKVGP